MTDANEISIAPDRPQTKFELAQLFIVVTICAVSLAFAFPSSRMLGQIQPNQFFWRLVYGLSSFTVSAFSLLGAALVVSKWIRERALPQEPGCLLFLFCASAVVLSNMVEIIFASLLDVRQPNNEIQSVGYATGFLYVKCLVQIFLAVVCAFGFPRNRWWWQIGFLGLTFAMLAKLAVIAMSVTLLGPMNNVQAYRYVQIASVVVFSVTFIWLLACGLIDLAKKVKRSRLHWFGVVCFLVFSILPTITGLIAMRFLTYRQIIGVD